MSKMVLNKHQINEIKIALAVLKREGITPMLSEDKLYQLADALDIGDETTKNAWVSDLWGAVMDPNGYEEIQKCVLKCLIEKEAYLEIVELGLHKIKLELEWTE